MNQLISTLQIELYDLELSIEVLSSGSGPRALFVPGLGESAPSWGMVIDVLKSDFSCFAVTLPRSYTVAEQPKFFSPEMYADLVTKIMTTLGGIELLVGHSIGGSISLYTKTDASVRKIIVEQTLDFRSFASVIRALWKELLGPTYKDAFLEEGEIFSISDLDETAKTTILSGREKLQQGAIIALWSRLVSMSDNQLLDFITKKLRDNCSPLTLVSGHEFSEDYKSWIRTNCHSEPSFVYLQYLGHWPHLTNSHMIADVIRHAYNENYHDGDDTQIHNRAAP